MEVAVPSSGSRRRSYTFVSFPFYSCSGGNSDLGSAVTFTGPIADAVGFAIQIQVGSSIYMDYLNCTEGLLYPVREREREKGKHF